MCLPVLVCAGTILFDDGVLRIVYYPIMGCSRGAAYVTRSWSESWQLMSELQTSVTAV